jgi:hypothetical protein
VKPPDHPSNSTGTTCDREVTRKGEFAPCEKRATGVAYWEGHIYPACNAHRMSSAALLVAYLADRSY